MTSAPESTGAASGAPDRIEIARDKRRPARFLVVAVLGFVASVASVATLGERGTGLHLLLHSLGLMACTFFAFAMFAMLRRLAFRGPGLVLDAEGMIDRSSDMGLGRVRWDEISEIRVTQSAERRFLTVIVRDPAKFIARGGWAHRRVNEANYRHAGSPVNVATWMLRIPFDELVAKTGEFYRRYGTESP
jgi:hypothetical protein